MENGWRPLDNLHLFINRHGAEIFVLVEVEGLLCVADKSLDLIGHLPETPAALLLVTQRSSVNLPETVLESMLERIFSHVGVHTLVHEVCDAFVGSIVHHFDFDLLEDLRALLFALSVSLEFKPDLIEFHINFFDIFLVSLRRNDHPAVWL